jgi:Ni,Fe-hydrogenase I large subunit
MMAKEFTTNSWYDDPKGINYGRHMWKGKTKANASKVGAYTFAKTPRYYNNESTAPWEVADHPNDAYLPYEVGPLARMISNASLLTTPGGPATAGEVVAVDSGAFGCYDPGVLADVDAVLGGALGMGAIGVFPGRGANMAGHLTFLQTAIPGSPVFYLPPNAFSAQVLANGFHSDYMGGATLDRIAARTLETYYAGMQMLSWFNAIDGTLPNKTLYFTWGTKDDRTGPKTGKGAGLTEAPRGALGHWIVVGKKKKWKNKFKGKVKNYQIITPTAWNINPKDANDPTEKTLGLMGPIERCIWGTPLVAESEPLEILRVVHSFDPCCACTVHVMNPKKEKVAKVTLEALM